MLLVPETTTSDFNSVTDSAQQLGAMVAGFFYVYASDIASWVKQGTNPTASAADGSMYVPAGAQIVLDGGEGAKISVLRAGGSNGSCSLTRVKLQLF